MTRIGNGYFKPEGWPSCHEMLEIAESANASAPDGTFEEITFPAKDGWSVTFFFDGDSSPDYISLFTKPSGETFDPWHYPDLAEQWSPLKNWRDIGDLKRFEETGYIDSSEALFTSDPAAFDSALQAEKANKTPN